MVATYNYGSVYMTIMWLCFIRVSSVIEELLPFECRNFSHFFRPKPYHGDE